jgi:hypothetical protein
LLFIKVTETNKNNAIHFTAPGHAYDSYWQFKRPYLDKNNQTLDNEDKRTLHRLLFGARGINGGNGKSIVENPSRVHEQISYNSLAKRTGKLSVDSSDCISEDDYSDLTPTVAVKPAFQIPDPFSIIQKVLNPFLMFV